MPIINVIKDWSYGGCHVEAGLITADERWTVKFDNEDAPEIRQFLAVNAPGIPRRWGRHVFHRWLYVDTVDAHPLNGPCYFEVLVHYEGKTEGKTGAYDEPISPLALPPEINWGFAVHSVMIDRDIFRDESYPEGHAITNSAGQSYSTPIMEDVYDLVMSVQWNRPSFNRLLAAEYIGQINSDVFYGFPVKTVRCVNLAGAEVFTPYLVYYRHSYEFHIRWRGWKRKLLDEGFATKSAVVGGKPTFKQNKDEDNVVLSEPVKLNGAGLIIDDNDPGHFLEWDTLWPLPFSVFGLG